MKNILLIILLSPVIAFSQSIGIKTGLNFYKPFDYSKTVANPLIGVTFKYSPKRIGFGIEPSISSKKVFISSSKITDNSGNYIKTEEKIKNSTVLELPIYAFFKAIDNDFKLNIEAGTSFYGNSASMMYGMYAGYKLNDFSIGINYRINGVLSNHFASSYQSTFISVQYNF